MLRNWNVFLPKTSKTIIHATLLVEIIQRQIESKAELKHRHNGKQLPSNKKNIKSFSLRSSNLMMLLNQNSIPKTLGVNNTCYQAKYFLYLLNQTKDRQNQILYKSNKLQLLMQIVKYEICYLVILGAHKVFNNKYALNPSGKIRMLRTNPMTEATLRKNITRHPTQKILQL